MSPDVTEQQEERNWDVDLDVTLLCSDKRCFLPINLFIKWYENSHIKKEMLVDK